MIFLQILLQCLQVLNFVCIYTDNFCMIVFTFTKYYATIHSLVLLFQKNNDKNLLSLMFLFPIIISLVISIIKFVFPFTGKIIRIIIIIYIIWITVPFWRRISFTAGITISTRTPSASSVRKISSARGMCIAILILWFPVYQLFINKTRTSSSSRFNVYWWRLSFLLWYC